MGGVSVGTRLEEVGEGAGTVSCTIWFSRRMCAEVMQAPNELILSVLVSSINSTPDRSAARKKTGTCKRIRGERRWWLYTNSWPFFVN